MKQRVLTAALLIPPVLLAVFLSSSIPVLILALVGIWIAHSELERMFEKRFTFHRLILVAVVIALPWIAFSQFGSIDDQLERKLLALVGGLTTAWLVGTWGCLRLAQGRRGAFDLTAAGFSSIAGLGWIMTLKEIFAPPTTWDFATPVLLCLVPLWIGDTLAIFAGKAFGKHPLAPTISPKKTIEGGIANLLGCIGGAIGVAVLIHQPMLVGLLVGLAAGVLGQAGDLLESAMKRSAGVKDSGTLLPGHGGLLDRIDSILLSAPVVALIIVFLGK